MLPKLSSGIQLLTSLIKENVTKQIEEGELMMACGLQVLISVLFVLISAISVQVLQLGNRILVFGVVLKHHPTQVICPAAAGSGLPELIAYLNGTYVEKIFSLKAYVVKFVSCIMAVASGLPAGPEGPMISLGGLIGAGISQFKSKTLHFDMPFFKRLRNAEDRRNFLTAGAGAGVSAAFGAPVGGLLFALEEVSSFWSDKLGWQTFFCCMVATFTADLFSSAFEKFQYTGSFGLFNKDSYIIFHVDKAIPLNLLIFVPAVILGVICGVLGALFTFSSLKILRLRKTLEEKIGGRVILLKIVKVAEPVVIVVVVSVIKVLVADLFPCTTNPNTESTLPVEQYGCNESCYNPFATLFFNPGEEAIHVLFSRQTLNLLTPLACALSLILYFPLAVWTCGTCLATGLVVPML
eukprot:sb/3465228/